VAGAIFAMAFLSVCLFVEPLLLIGGAVVGVLTILLQGARQQGPGGGGRGP
jgi:hypothetical protein